MNTRYPGFNAAWEQAPRWPCVDHPELDAMTFAGEKRCPVCLLTDTREVGKGQESMAHRDMIRQRTREALARLKAEGKRYCHNVYDRPEVITLMHRLRAEGYSYQRIADALNALGVPTLFGHPWQAMVVYDIIHRTQGTEGAA
jgi:recombinase